MYSPQPADTHASLPLVEGGLTAVAFAISFAFPHFGSGMFARIERAFGGLARRRHLSVVVIGLAALLLRLAILPFCPIPLPFCTDDFSFLLAADTFLHGRLANPTPAMWVHFETIHVDMQPTYASMYFPAQGLVIAAGRLLFGHPWAGILLTSAAMCAAICWMLQAWLPARWALLGGFVAVIHIGLFSYWVNSYHSAGAVGAVGGALVLGSLPRLKKTARFRYGILMAAGISILVLTRPYEGMLLCLPVAVSLGLWILRGKSHPMPAVLLRRGAVPLALIAGTFAWLGHYDHAAFGKATTLPYSVNRATYAMAPYFVWQNPRPEPAYRHTDLRRFYYVGELQFYHGFDTPTGFVKQSLIKGMFTCFFFSGFALLPPLMLVRRVFLDRRIRFLVLSMLVLAAGMVIQIFIIPHYVAPFTAALYAIGLQAMRHLWVWKPEGKPVGQTIGRMCVTVCVVTAALRLFAVPLGFPFKEWPVMNWNFTWYGPDRFGMERHDIEQALEKLPGKQLAMVYHGTRRNVIDEWVYNSADIDSQKVVWARDMDVRDNAELIEHYKDRHIWLVNADTTPATLIPYSAPAQLTLAARESVKGIQGGELDAAEESKQ